ncbi:MAG: hypothetical protein K6A82_02355 [Prevotella sp.]|nr:hypothetical protein [Prevotella sp.]
MKQIEVKRLSCRQVKAADIPDLFKTEQVVYHRIETIDWPVDYPYCPRVEFAIAHKSDAILLHYRVEEDGARAVSGADLGPVWEDSCCEFFVSPDDRGGYYNLECNCIGTVLLCNGQAREGRTAAPTAVLGQIDRWASFGRVPFGMKRGAQTWELSLAVPVSSFFRHEIKNLAGLSMRANFYKCGDRTPRPHFLSWNPIDLPSPDFHCPDFFGQISFL